jgi:hypothetical protein
MRNSASRHIIRLLPLILLLLPLVELRAQGRYVAVQLEALASQESAARRVAELKERGVEAYLVRSEIPGKGTLYRVRVGRFATAADARRMGASLQRQNLAVDFFVTSWEPPFTIGGDPRPGRPAVLPEPAPAAEAVSAVQRPTVTRTSPPRVDQSPQNRAVGASSTPITSAGPSPGLGTSARTYVSFTDPSIGYTFDHPKSWDGGVLASREVSEQNINGGALFRSSTDRAFLNVIWNQLDQANNPEHDNDMIVSLILRSMSSGEGTKEMKETSRRVVSSNGQIRTYLDLRARFDLAGNTSNLDFSGKAVIVRNARGILLVVTFYSNVAPTDLPAVADRILASVILP